MRRGRLFAVVGASGVGKDTIMAALAKARPELHWVRRAITRPSHEGDEPFEPVSASEFQLRLDDGAFALHWTAHGLSYGVPNCVHGVLAEGRDAMVNLSRGMLVEADQVFPGMQVLNITVSDEVRAERLAARGRETAADIAQRLSRVVPDFAPTLRVTDIDNSASLERSVAACLQLMDRETA